MKKIINIFIICASFLLSFYIFGDYLLKLISLKNENEKAAGIITELQKAGYRNRRLRIEYNYDYMGKGHNDKVTVSSGLFKKLYMMKIFNNYHIGQKIYILIKLDNTFTFPEDEIDPEIFERIFLLLSLPLLVTFFIRIFLFRKYLIKSDKKMKKTNKKVYYKYYIQRNDHKNEEKNMGEKISLDDIIKYMNYDELRKNDIMCCGIEKGNDFVEISFFENEYQLRIFKNGDKKIETIGDYSKINEIIYRNINYGNGT
jgi:hypothetical protein